MAYANRTDDICYRIEQTSVDVDVFYVCVRCWARGKMSLFYIVTPSEHLTAVHVKRRSVLKPYLSLLYRHFPWNFWRWVYLLFILLFGFTRYDAFSFHNAYEAWYRYSLQCSHSIIISIFYCRVLPVNRSSIFVLN